MQSRNTWKMCSLERKGAWTLLPLHSLDSYNHGTDFCYQGEEVHFHCCKAGTPPTQVQEKMLRTNLKSFHFKRESGNFFAWTWYKEIWLHLKMGSEFSVSLSWFCKHVDYKNFRAMEACNNPWKKRLWGQETCKNTRFFSWSLWVSCTWSYVDKFNGELRILEIPETVYLLNQEAGTKWTSSRGSHVF